MTRVQMLVGAAALLTTASSVKLAHAAERYAVAMSPAAWLRKLGPARYAILREGGTEAPYSSPLDKEFALGTYLCAGCNQAAFSSTTKYHAGEGWPSFWNVLPGAVRFQKDYQLLGEVRTEVHCSRCGGHLGHRFHDGPQPTGLRYCIDGLALRFIPRHDAGRG
uniref:Protein-methionine-S-oxide reductase n=1 Tax=mine drainage metagenome TaxID=410659 RepID=E6PHZ9_9ZZZZ